MGRVFNGPEWGQSTWSRELLVVRATATSASGNEGTLVEIPPSSGKVVVVTGSRSSGLATTVAVGATVGTGPTASTPIPRPRAKATTAVSQAELGRSGLGGESKPSSTTLPVLAMGKR
jgi:hypothetical protein